MIKYLYYQLIKTGTMFTNHNTKYIYKNTVENGSIEGIFYQKYYWIVSWSYLKLRKRRQGRTAG